MLRTMFAGPLVLLTTLAATTSVWGQIGQIQDPPGGYWPVDQRTRPGVAAAWTATRNNTTPGRYFQPVRLELPTAGQVSIYAGLPHQAVPLAAPAQVGVLVGHVYRMRIGEMPQYPGVELYPTIEVLDRLHPPPGQEDRFPVPIELTEEDIELALSGRLVTKVIYLEQPQLARPLAQDETIPVATIPESRNVLAEADLLGRPMLILRLGSRGPNVHGADPAFFGTGAPVVLPRGPVEQPPITPEPRRPYEELPSPEAE